MIRTLTAIVLLSGIASAAGSKDDLLPDFVQDLPPDKDPRIITAQDPEPTDILRDFTPEETAARETSMATVDMDAQKKQLKNTAQTFDMQAASVSRDIDTFCSQQNIAPAASAPIAQEVEEASGVSMPPVGPNTMVINNDGGFYFDKEKGLLVYPRNVQVRSARLNIDCKKQLKIYLAESKDPKKKKKIPAEPKKGEPAIANIDFNYDDVKLITADGDVFISGTNKKGEPFRAYGDKMTYDNKSGETILTGTDLYVVQNNTNAQRVTGEGSFIRLYENGDVYAKGKQSTTQIDNLRMQQDKNKKDKKKK